MFKRIKTSRECHDSLILGVMWRPQADLEFTIQLDTHWNAGRAETATLRFMNVKNKAEVDETMDTRDLGWRSSTKRIGVLFGQGMLEGYARPEQGRKRT